MDIIFMNYKNSRKSHTHKLFRLLLNLTDEINLKCSDKYVKNNKSKTPAPKWNEEFELPDGLHSVSNIQDYFEYIFKIMDKRLLIFQ